MDLADAPDEARFRQNLRTWLEKNLPQLPWPEPADLVAKVPFWRTWQSILFEAGYAGLTWPREYGGQGLDERMRAIFGEECDLAGAPERLNPIGEDFAGPTIAHFGSQAQKRRFLRPILTGEEIWCQLFSEPDSGSDLASLRTKATKVEGGWRIQGQKIWTSRAQLAAHAILLARTGGGPRHKGITYFLLPMDSEGVTVRPLAHMLGEAEFNEVFLDEVFLPDDAVVGELYFCPLVEDLADFRLSLEPLAGQFGLDDASQEAARARPWLRLANQARGTAIAGGSTFIQRNIVAERVLGMPR